MRSISILPILMALTGVTRGSDLPAWDSLQSSVKQVLARYGSDSFPVRYAFAPGDFMRPGNPTTFGWDSTLRNAWLYAPEIGLNCAPVEDFQADAEGIQGFAVARKTRRGDTTFLVGWDMAWDRGPGGPVSFLSSNYSLTRKGDTSEAASGGNAETDGSLGHVSRQALHFDAVPVYPAAEKGSTDTLFFEDPAGRRLTCARIGSIDIDLTNGTDYTSRSAPPPKAPNRTLACASLPPKCPVDTGEILLREITRAIGDFGFAVGYGDNGSHAVLFRSRADCKRYGDRLTKRKR